jgi:D-beta-D-heptose 7-phosphate kinase/D-beta-D-heptose 1-phosphate adenosyltransferase
MGMRLANLVKNLPQKHILVVGDMMLDRYVRGNVNRISPEAPIQILNVEHEEARPGGAANVANNLRELGARVTIVGQVGDDKPAHTLIELLKQRGITPVVVETKHKPTSTKTRIIAHNQQMLRVDEEKTDPLCKKEEKELITKIKAIINDIDCVVVSDYNKGTLTQWVCRGLVSNIKKHRKLTIVGLKSRDYGKYKNVDGVSLNRGELNLISNTADIKNGATRIIKELGLKFLVVTLGEKGLNVFTKDKKVYVPATARQVYDVTGAGDTVLAVYSYCMSCNIGVDDSARIANTAAGIVVGRLGTATVSRSEIVSSILGYLPVFGQKIIDRKDIPLLVKKLKEEGKRIVFTNGCFDLLHLGHVRLLQFAKSRGDILIVGLNSDSSVKKLKGQNRPIINQQDRERFLAALESVDYVVVFSEETPLNLIRKIRPDVLVKGADWLGKKIVGREFVERYGGRVEVAPYIEGYSSSGLIERIKEL